MLRIKFAFVLLFLALAVQAKPYDPEVLTLVEERVIEAVQRGETPVVLFDLDDTLTHSRSRTLRIYRELAAEPAFKKKHPAAAEALAKVHFAQIKYWSKDTLAGLGLPDETLLAEVSEFWAKRFFSDAYVALDAPVMGGADYVNGLRDLGATIVYLTGRDAPRMEAGTRLGLFTNGFPLHDGAHLFLKPNKDLEDLAFKKEVFERLNQMGTMVGVFENEPANLNAMMERFPQATGVFIDTIHSPKPIVPAEGASWIGSYRRE